MTVVWKLESATIIIIVLLFLLGLGMGTRRLQVDFWQISFQKTEIFIITRPSASINLWQKHCFPQEVLATYENIIVAVKQ